MPAYTDSAAIYSVDWPSGGSWFTLDVTEFVKVWQEGSITNYGIYCHSRSCTSTCDCAYYSSDVSNPAFRPSLTVTYSPHNNLDTSSWGEIKANSGTDCECEGECQDMLPPPPCHEP